MSDSRMLYCSKCGKTKKADQFYSSNNLEKYPNNGGKFPMCKDCMTRHVDNWDPNTYLWILQEADVPYIPDEWNKLLVKYGADPAKVTGATIMGRYLSKMKLTQYKNYRWKDNEVLKRMREKKIREAMKESGYTDAEVDEALDRTKHSNEDADAPNYDNILSNLGVQVAPPPPPPTPSSSPAWPTAPSAVLESEIDLGLTDEDITYLRLKWGKGYRQEEWVQLEQLYNDMMQSYDIQTAGHIDTLKLICKTSLKANQLIDLGDIDGYQKVSKVYDSLMKSGKFTAAQNKAEQGEFVDSISELVAICERDGFIPKYYTDGPQDKVDRVIEDMQHYTRTLVMEEMGLSNLIENAIKTLEDKKERETNADVETDDDLYDYDNKVIVNDEDFEDFYNEEEEMAEADAEFLKQFYAEED